VLVMILNIRKSNGVSCPWPQAALPRVNDEIQTCPTVCKSGTLVQSTIPAFFCNISSLHLGHWMGFSHDILISRSIILQNATGSDSSENLFLTRKASCASRVAFWKSVLPSSGILTTWHTVAINVYRHVCTMCMTCSDNAVVRLQIYMVHTFLEMYKHVCTCLYLSEPVYMSVHGT
jgi:hypothetical protein